MIISIIILVGDKCMLNQSFDVLIEEDKETKQYYGSVPNLPGCYSTGDTVEELITNMKEAISLYLEVKKEEKSKLLNNNVLGLIRVTL